MAMLNLDIALTQSKQSTCMSPSILAHSKQTTCMSPYLKSVFVYPLFFFRFSAFFLSDYRDWKPRADMCDKKGEKWVTRVTRQESDWNSGPHRSKEHYGLCVHRLIDPPSTPLTSVLTDRVDGEQSLFLQIWTVHVVLKTLKENVEVRLCGWNIRKPWHWTAWMCTQ